MFLSQNESDSSNLESESSLLSFFDDTDDHTYEASPYDDKGDSSVEGGNGMTSDMSSSQTANQDVTMAKTRYI